MAKKRYKIPTSLDVTYMDMEFNFTSKNGVGINKPVSAKVVVFTLTAGFAWFYGMFQTFLGRGGIALSIGISIAWVALSVIMIKTDPTGRTGLELIMSLINYIPKSGRALPTRMSDNVAPLKNFMNVYSVDVEDGRINYLDGDIGHVYHIVGSASSLMFEQDKQMIVDKVDSFYRKLAVGAEITYDTVYEGHVVDQQLIAVDETRRNLKSKSAGLRVLLDEQDDILRYAINNNQGLTSLHQYLIVKVPNEEALRDFETLLIGDVEGQGLMFRLAKTLNFDETVKYLNTVFGPIPK